LSSIPLGTVPRGVAVDSSSGSVYTVLYLNGTTLALDPHTLDVAARIATPSPYAVAVDSSTDRVYVSQGQGSSIAVIDGSSNKVVASVDGAGTPYALAVDEAHDLVLAADTGANSLWIVDGSTDTVSGRVQMGDTSALALDQGSREAFIGNLSAGTQSGSIIVVNTSSKAVIRTVPIPIPPGRFAFDPVSHLLYVTSGDSTGSGVNFMAINDQTFQTVYSVHLGDSPNIVTVASSPDVYVSDSGLNRLYEIDGSTGSVLSNSTGDAAADISFTGITGMAYGNATGSLYITEDGVTSLVILGPAAASSGSGAIGYLAVGVIAIIVLAVAGISAVAILRRRSQDLSSKTLGSHTP
jgi:DNA-binding beta-propeller fold protein YncE